MPIYDQECQDCGNEFEIIVPRFDSPRPCPRCHSTNTEQFVSACAFKFVSPKFEVKRGAAHNPFDNLTLQHIHDESGKPITVHSERELREAEKKYNFVHAASWGLENEPPQHEKWAGDISHGYKRKWNHDDRAYSQSEIDKAKSGIGFVERAEHTLADRPNSHRPV